MNVKILALIAAIVLGSTLGVGAQSLPLDANGNVKTAVQAQSPPADVSGGGSVSGNAQGAFVNLNGQAGCVAQVTGASISGVLSFQVSYDNGVTYQPLFMVPNGGGPSASTATGAGTWTASCIGATQFKIVSSSWVSGTATLALRGTVGGGASGGNITSPIGAAGGVKTEGTGTAGTPSGGVHTVQGVAGMQPVVVNGTSSVSSQTGGTPPATLVPTISYPHCIYSTSAAAPTNNTAVPCQVDSSGNLKVIVTNQGAWTGFAVPASALCVSAPCVIKSSAGTFGGIISESTSAQPAGNCTWYDSASAASGNVLYLETTIGAGQIITVPYPGLSFTNGIVVQCAANPGGNGLLVLYK